MTAIILTSIVNASAAIVAVRINKEGAMDDEDFWSKERVVNAWKIYLYLCAAIALAVTLALLIATCKLVQTLQSFFKDQFGKQARSLIIFTTMILTCSLAAILNDLVIAILESKDESLSPEADGQVAACYLLLIPSAVVNVLHFKNMRSQAKLQNDGSNSAEVE